MAAQLLTAYAQAAEAQWNHEMIPIHLSCRLFPKPALVNVFLFQSTADKIIYEVVELDFASAEVVGGPGGETCMSVFNLDYRKTLQNVWQQHHCPLATFQVIWPYLHHHQNQFMIDRTAHLNTCNHFICPCPIVTQNDLICSSCGAPSDIIWKPNMNRLTFQTE